MVLAGEQKLKKALDTRSIINLMGKLKSLLRHEYTRTTRYLMGIQRRETVLEQDISSMSDSSDEIDDLNKVHPDINHYTLMP